MAIQPGQVSRDSSEMTRRSLKGLLCGGQPPTELYLSPNDMSIPIGGVICVIIDEAEDGEAVCKIGFDIALALINS